MILKSKNGKERVYKIGQNDTLKVKMKGNEAMVTTSLYTDEEYDKTLEELHNEFEYRLSIDEKLNNLFKNDINPTK